jgi:hypothetical protein
MYFSFIGFEKRGSCLFHGARKEKVYAELCTVEVEEWCAGRGDNYRLFEHSIIQFLYYLKHFGDYTLPPASKTLC